MATAPPQRWCIERLTKRIIPDVFQQAPKPRIYHKTTMYKEFIYMFGGMNDEGGTLSDFYKYDTQTQQWHNLSHVEKALGAYPMGRRHHTLITHEATNKIYMHGGEGEDGDITKEMWVYDIEKDQWELVRPSEGDAPYLSGHGAVINDQTIYYIGGEESIDEGLTSTTTSTIHKYSIIKKKWTTITIPEFPKRAFASVSKWNAFILVSGGENEEGEESDQSFLLSIKHRLAVELLGIDGPSPRSYGSSFVFGSQWVIFGGLPADEKLDSTIHAFDFYEDTWQVPFALDIRPRYGHTVNMMYHTENAVFKVFVFGGSDDAEDESHVLSHLVELELVLSKVESPCFAPPILDYVALAITSQSKKNNETPEKKKHSEPTSSKISKTKEEVNKLSSSNSEKKSSTRNKTKSPSTKKSSSNKISKSSTSSTTSTTLRTKKKKATKKTKSPSKSKISNKTSTTTPLPKESFPKSREDVKPQQPAMRGNQQRTQFCGIS